jgi:hypothetical protein
VIGTFVELLSGELFTAKSTATKWEDCRKLLLGERVSREMIREAKDLDIENLPIAEGSTVIGYAKTHELRQGMVVSQSKIHHSFQESIVDSSERLPALARRFLQDGLDNYKLYFVTDGGRNPLGIMTYADLNRRTSYIYSYVMMSFLEQWAKMQIENRYRLVGRRLSKKWMSSLSVERRSLLVRWAAEKHQSTLGVASLEDLVRILRRDVKQDMDRNFKRMLASALSIRPRVAHPVKLLVPRKDSEGLSHLLRFWDGMLPLIEREDYNFKVGGWGLHVA